MKPYATLKIGLDASTEEIARAYRNAVRQFPPERRPEQFTKVNSAYDELKDPDRRMDRLLAITSLKTGKVLEDTPSEAVMGFLRASLLPDPPDEAAFFRFLEL